MNITQSSAVSSALFAEKIAFSIVSEVAQAIQDFLSVFLKTIVINSLNVDSTERIECH